MAKLRKDEVADIDVQDLDDAEYSEDDLDSYSGRVPDANTELTGYVARMFWCRTQEKDDGSGLDPMLKVLWIAGDNEGELEEYNGLPVVENLVLVKSTKFRWAPFFRVFGIELKDIRIRRVNYPEQVRTTIFDRIKSERATKAAEYQRQGTTLAAEITSNANKTASIIRTDARAKADRLRGDAIAEADRIRNAAHRQERDFYKFLKKLEDYGRILGDSKTILYLSTQRELFDVLLNPQSGSKPAAKPKGNGNSVRKGGK